MTLAIERVTGGAIADWLPALAALRIAVFREWPYLYEGSLAYEREYLGSYAASPHAVVVLVRDGDRVVGASTAMPLLQHSEEVAPPLVAAGYAPETVWYLGESVLDPAYRGRGLGHTFFVEREAHGRALGYAIATFCAVERPADHPRRPAGYRPLDELWRKHGYVKRPDIATTFSWLDIGDAAETAKPMVFWLKELA